MKTERTASELHWLEEELADTLDEDYELEISEPALSDELRRIYKHHRPPTIARQEYFRALLRLQAELIKLQGWVEHTESKIVVIFEGRDAPAGRPGEEAVVLPALRPASARRRGNRPLRSLLVQPLGRRAGHGICQ